MREFVLNHLSVKSPNYHTAVRWLKALAYGIGHLASEKVATSSLRTHLHLYEIECLPGYSLNDALHSLRQAGERDAYLSLVRMGTKYPLLHDTEENVRDRFLSCESIEFPNEDGAPLVLCAIADWIAVGFPSDELWDRDSLTVSFNELLPDENIEVAVETVDHLARRDHAWLIWERHRASVFRSDSPTRLWERRKSVFPNLTFGPDVEMPKDYILPILKRLSQLDATSNEWRASGGAIPPWNCKVTPESERVRNDRRLLNERRFRSINGSQDLFEWHARVGSGIRIHLRFDVNSRDIEIGYIGYHLPL